MSWWRHAVFYQVYVWSFADSDGDGIGDLPGVRSRLPYLRDLGVDAVWLNPFYPSPQADNGYDVADYRDVDPRFGTLADADALIRDAHDLGLRIIIDLVPNHTSSEHPWFRAALADGPGSAARRRYLFRDGRGPGGAQPPNNWTSNFGGRAWTRVPDGQWYLHLFAPAQPDLDWTSAEVRDEFHSILRFWLDRGVDGFRIDVAHGLAKDPQMPDLGADPTRTGACHPHWDVDEVHDVYRGWRQVLDTYPGDRMFVGEVVVQSVERLALYLRPDELHTAFNFALLMAPWQAAALRRAIGDSIAALAAVGAPPTWVLSNHDETRHVTRYGGGTLGVRRARAAALLMLALPGGAYLYQGEELGLPEVELPDRVRRDPVFYRTGGAQRGRDGCRVPLPWSGNVPSFGFGPGREAWLPQPATWRALTAERQAADPSSMLQLYRAALTLRRPIDPAAPLTWLPTGPDVLAFRRGPGFVCVANLGDAPAPLPAGASVMLASGPIDAGTLPADTTAWLG
ncbi:alpha-glucosidase [Paractinoplanes abujensis]|uniref:Alpha-glucosidase n=1 Tax=Paractinoplanes abujensis TaxID=882441 RepID=A0A7W7FZZ1_9ACTN|nr:alpha-amylase family glycosyl hydrolase [Actinoplanes abujensis]MBB4691087.1 alpha-glucosidase [Actinoplanes abujensis]GID17500.1 alpha-glucosidase [Actinoplanes abujensis]